MRKTLIIAIGAAVALVTAAVAVAVVPTAVGVSEATATFSTSTVERLKARECTGADGKAFRITEARYTGTMVSTNAVLAGPLTIHARTTFSASDSLGYVEGSFRVKDDDSRVSGRFSGTLKGGKLVGFLTGTSRGHHARVLGNLSATFDPAASTAFSGGALGSGSSGALAVIAGPVCRGHKPSPRPVKPKRLEIHGTLSLGTGTVSVTRGALTATCTVDKDSPSLNGFAKDDKVEMKCENPGSGWLLRGLKKDGPPAAPRPKRLEIHGTLSLGTGTVSVTRGALTATCTVDKDSPSLNGFAKDDKVEMKCENPGSGWLLRGLKKDS